MTTTAARSVLTDQFLLSTIAGFQVGLPQDVWEVVIKGAGPGKHLCVPTHAIKTRNLPLLQRAYQQYQLYPLSRFLSFASVWEEAVCTAFLEALQWLDALPMCHSHALSPEDLAAILRVQDQEVIRWLLKHRPEYAAYLMASDLQRVIRSGNMNLLESLWKHNADVPITTTTIELAIRNGKLEMIKFLHENMAGVPITTKAMDFAAECGQLKIVQFLHENRTEGCTKAAMDNAIAWNHEEVVDFLRKHRTEGYTRAILKAVKNRFKLGSGNDLLCILEDDFPEWEQL